MHLLPCPMTTVIVQLGGNYSVKIVMSNQLLNALKTKAVVNLKFQMAV